LASLRIVAAFAHLRCEGFSLHNGDRAGVDSVVSVVVIGPKESLVIRSLFQKALVFCDSDGIFFLIRSPSRPKAMNYLVNSLTGLEL
jgi:hypothetical protein